MASPNPASSSLISESNQFDPGDNDQGQGQVLPFACAIVFGQGDKKQDLTLEPDPQPLST